MYLLQQVYYVFNKWQNDKSASFYTFVQDQKPEFCVGCLYVIK